MCEPPQTAALSAFTGAASDDVCKLAGLPDDALPRTQVDIRGQTQPLIVRTEKDPTVLASLLTPAPIHEADRPVIGLLDEPET